MDSPVRFVFVEKCQERLAGTFEARALHGSFAKKFSLDESIVLAPPPLHASGAATNLRPQKLHLRGFPH
jgi:hypothetical protein